MIYGFLVVSDFRRLPLSELEWGRRNSTAFNANSGFMLANMENKGHVDEQLMDSLLNMVGEHEISLLNMTLACSSIMFANMK